MCSLLVAQAGMNACQRGVRIVLRWWRLNRRTAARSKGRQQVETYIALHFCIASGSSYMVVHLPFTISSTSYSRSGF